jgi:hypothetical protein
LDNYIFFQLDGFPVYRSGAGIAIVKLLQYDYLFSEGGHLVRVTFVFTHRSEKRPVGVIEENRNYQGN